MALFNIHAMMINRCNVPSPCSDAIRSIDDPIGARLCFLRRRRCDNDRAGAAALELMIDCDTDGTALFLRLRIDVARQFYRRPRRFLRATADRKIIHDT
ncbi:MAG: hypothetical protein ACT6XY_01520 [Phreatobacter sp.]|uniref:hypothetical protein n=1 Tax=Phreatobacter sp. TaxID=1966341 RepID=UPI0040369B2C